MPIVAADLLQRSSANMPEADTGASGGAIDLTGKVAMTPLAANDAVGVVSDNAGDTTQTITITGRNAAGAIVTDGPLTLTGTTRVAGTIVFERILKIVKSVATTGTVTINRNTGGAVVATMEPTVVRVGRHFYDSSSESAQTKRYEKHFWKNNHGTLTLNSAQVTLTADPQAVLKIALDAAKNGTESVVDRRTAPSGKTWTDDGVGIAVPTNTLAAAEAIGVWVEMTLAAGAAAFKNTLTTQLSGTTV